eukprot:TRINITY_DN770_c0_g1_i3.p2 TRINITY_DN770_c0_g1~~TRINITY_DN770_c0_g1_i3.p2  ORF type:complete len:117 (-),score=2.77 TRINITY_DN770_c0_g1_i3:14-364(-)
MCIRDSITHALTVFTVCCIRREQEVSRSTKCSVLFIQSMNLYRNFRVSFERKFAQNLVLESFKIIDASKYKCRTVKTVSYTHLRAHETDSYLVCRLLLEKKKKNILCIVVFLKLSK